MKKRAMKKWIPKNTCYCYNIIDKTKEGKLTTKNCKWYKYLKSISGFKSYEKVFKCEYLGYIDYEQDSLLWDKCKECGIKDY